MKRLFRKLLMGDTAFSEYSKVTVADAIPEKVYLEVAGKRLDVSGLQWVLCIEPIMFGVWIEKKEDAVFHTKATEYFLHVGNTEAIVKLSLFTSIQEEKGTLLVLELKKSNIHQFPFIKTWLLFFRYYKKDGLTFNRFKSFVSAYSYPRRVRLVSFRQNDYYNIFPMDLTGDISHTNRYVFGLRHTNIALPKIMETKKLVISEVSYKHKDIIYQLGKHHSSSPPAIDTLAFNIQTSKNFEFYIPGWVERYTEIRILQTVNMGSHMLLWGEVVATHTLTDPADHLFIVHFLHFLHQKNKGVPYKLA
jgi:flavin reductase (DIM6/NTAB) family NADH-FMN oxidoreductase RutF